MVRLRFHRLRRLTDRCIPKSVCLFAAFFLSAPSLADDAECKGGTYYIARGDENNQSSVMLRNGEYGSYRDRLISIRVTEGARSGKTRSSHVWYVFPQCVESLLIRPVGEKQAELILTLMPVADCNVAHQTNDELDFALQPAPQQGIRLPSSVLDDGNIDAMRRYLCLGDRLVAE